MIRSETKITSRLSPSFHVSVSGQVLREALANTGITLPDAIAPLIRNAQTLSKSGTSITIQNKEEQIVSVGEGKNATKMKIDKTVAFNVEVGKGTASLTNFSGLHADHWSGWKDFHDIKYSSIGQGQGMLDVHVGPVTRHFACSSDGCKQQ